MSGYIGTQPVPQATQTRDSFTATSGQTSFATGGYTPNYLDVYLNGVKLAAADYTATNGSDVVLASGASTGDILEVVAYTTFTTADIPAGTPSIDDNGNATAITIDSSENVLAGKSSQTIDTVGVELLGSLGKIHATRDGGASAGFNRKTSDGDIAVFYKDGSTVGSIGNGSNNLVFYLAGTQNAVKLVGPAGGVDAFAPASTSGLNRDNAMDLGWSSNRFKDAYLSGGVYLGGTGSANKLDDYEEGTSSPQIVGGFFNMGTATLGSYTKVGNIVNFQAKLIFPSTSNTSEARITLPFVVSSRDNHYPTGKCSSNGNTSASLCLGIAGQSYIVFQNDSGGTTATNANLSNANINVNITYQTTP